MSSNYTETLKKIKETEEASNQTVSETRKALEAELKALEEESTKAIAATKEEADAQTSREVEGTRAAAQAEAGKVIAATTEQADALASKKLQKQDLRKIVDDVLLAEFKV